MAARNLPPHLLPSSDHPTTHCNDVSGFLMADNVPQPGSCGRQGVDCRATMKTYTREISAARYVSMNHSSSPPTNKTPLVYRTTDFSRTPEIRSENVAQQPCALDATHDAEDHHPAILFRIFLFYLLRPFRENF